MNSFEKLCPNKKCNHVNLVTQIWCSKCKCYLWRKYDEGTLR